MLAVLPGLVLTATDPPADGFAVGQEPVNHAIRQASVSAAAEKAERRAEWFVSELSRLAERLEHGTLYRSDFELLKARITGGY
jgi:hypothetical protein